MSKLVEAASEFLSRDTSTKQSRSEDNLMLTQEEFDSLSEGDQEEYLYSLEQLDEVYSTMSRLKYKLIPVLDEATDYALVHSSSGREVDRGSKDDMVKKARAKEQGSHHVAAVQKPTTASKLSRLARKIIPGQGQKQAGERAKSQEYSAGLDRAALKYHPDDKKLQTTMKSSEKAQKRYERISQGKSPFKSS